ncbi:MAG TPA: ABC transporter ATP-binding protein [Candidatus Limnocylindria bacterium]|nr:ABC transporter ATP-binding protein [Candidatus Limnocylindria bacterium]
MTDVSLTIAPGELVILLGPSGSGKTTLLKMVNRLYEPTSGQIWIDDVEVHDLKPSELRRHIGYVIQQSGLFPHMRVADNVAVVPKLLGWDKHRIRQRVDELLDLVGLPPQTYRRRYPSQLSGGEQQRVGLARALAAEPTTMLMDEPFGALDAITRARLQEELLRIHRQLGQTILFVTHDIEEAVRLAQKIVVMRNGRVVQYDTPVKILTEPANDFVAELVGANDVLRRMSLLPVDLAIEPLSRFAANGVPEISRDAFLRDALSQLVDSGADHLVVVDDNDHPVGALSLESIQRAAAPPERPAEPALDRPA